MTTDDESSEESGYEYQSEEEEVVSEETNNLVVVQSFCIVNLVDRVVVRERMSVSKNEWTIYSKNGCDINCVLPMDNQYLLFLVDQKKVELGNLLDKKVQPVFDFGQNVICMSYDQDNLVILVEETGLWRYKFDRSKEIFSLRSADSSFAAMIINNICVDGDVMAAGTKTGHYQIWDIKEQKDGLESVSNMQVREDASVIHVAMIGEKVFCVSNHNDGNFLDVVDSRTLQRIKSYELSRKQIIYFKVHDRTLYIAQKKNQNIWHSSIGEDLELHFLDTFINVSGYGIYDGYVHVFENGSKEVSQHILEDKTLFKNIRTIKRRMEDTENHLESLNKQIKFYTQCLEQDQKQIKALSEHVVESYVMCAICMVNRKDRVLACNHTLCHQCVSKIERKCPMCREAVKSEDIRRMIL